MAAMWNTGSGLPDLLIGRKKSEPGFLEHVRFLKACEERELRGQ